MQHHFINRFPWYAPAGWYAQWHEFSADGDVEDWYCGPFASESAAREYLEDDWSGRYIPPFLHGAPVTPAAD